jgi:hypothetical protein
MTSYPKTLTVKKLIKKGFFYYKDILHFFFEWPIYYTCQKWYLWLVACTTTDCLLFNTKFCIIFNLQEVEELFSGEGCPKYISCEPAHNNYWYIQFESEDCAQKVCKPLIQWRYVTGLEIAGCQRAKAGHILEMAGKTNLNCQSKKNGSRYISFHLPQLVDKIHLYLKCTSKFTVVK